MVLYIIAQHKLEHNYKNPKKLCCASHIPSTSALFVFVLSSIQDDHLTSYREAEGGAAEDP